MATLSSPDRATIEKLTPIMENACANALVDQPSLTAMFAQELVAETARGADFQAHECQHNQSLVGRAP